MLLLMKQLRPVKGAPPENTGDDLCCSPPNTLKHLWPKH